VREPLRVAAVQPACAARDVAGNAEVHAAAIRAAEAQVVVFPELSLTGYELDASSVAPDDPALTPIVDACAAMGSLALVGAPVADEQGRLFIAMLPIDADGGQIAYCKTWLGGREPARFTPGGGPATLDVDAYLAGLVHRPQELPEQEARAVVIEDVAREVAVDELRARLDGALRRHSSRTRASRPTPDGRGSSPHARWSATAHRSVRPSRTVGSVSSRTLSWNASPTRRMSSHLPG